MDEPGEVSILLRIKATIPATPIYAVIPRSNRDFDELVRESGAEGVAPTREDLGRLIDEVSRTTASTESLIRRSRAAAQRNRVLRGRMAELLIQSKPIRAGSFDATRIPATESAPLLVEDDPNQALLMLRCFEKANLPFPLPVMRDGEEAIDYLKGQGKYADRVLFPLPSLVILDLHLPKQSGFDVLAWIRSRPELSKLVVFVLTTSPVREDLERAYGMGADYYVTKPMSLEGLREVVQVLAMRWALIHRARRS